MQGLSACSGPVGTNDKWQGLLPTMGDDTTSIQIPVLTMPSAAKPPPMLHGASKSARHLQNPKTGICCAWCFRRALSSWR